MMAFIASLALSDTPVPHNSGIEIWRGGESSDPERRIVVIKAPDTVQREKPGILSSGEQSEHATMRQGTQFPTRRESLSEEEAGEKNLTQRQSGIGIRKAAVYDFRQKPVHPQAVDHTGKTATESFEARAKRYPRTAVVYDFPQARGEKLVKRRSPSPDVQSREHYLSVGRQLLADADELANSGDFHRAVHLVRDAQSLPVDWSPEEFSPDTFLEELKRRYAEATATDRLHNRQAFRGSESSPRVQPEDSGHVVPGNDQSRFGSWTGLDDDEAILQTASQEAESFPEKSRQESAVSVSPANHQFAEEQGAAEQEPQRLRIDEPTVPLQASHRVPPSEPDRSDAWSDDAGESERVSPRSAPRIPPIHRTAGGSAEIWYGGQPTTSSNVNDVASADSQSGNEATTDSELSASPQPEPFDQQMRIAESQLAAGRSAEIWYGDQPTSDSYVNEVAGADSQIRKHEPTTQSELPTSPQPEAFGQQLNIPESRVAASDETEFVSGRDPSADVAGNEITVPISESDHDWSLSESRLSQDRSPLGEENVSQARQATPNAKTFPVASRSNERSPDELHAAPLVVDGRRGLDATQRFSELLAEASQFVVPSDESGGIRREAINEFGSQVRQPAETVEVPAVEVLAEQTHPVAAHDSAHIRLQGVTVSAAQIPGQGATTSSPVGVVERTLTRKIAVPRGESIFRTADGPSPGTTIFTTVVVNLITVFAALVVGLFVLVLALFLILKGKAKGAGINLRVEFVGDQPLANFVLGSPTGVPLAYQAAPGGVAPVGTAYAAAESTPVSNAAAARNTKGNPTADILPFEPPILSLDEQRRKHEEEERAREQAILTQIVEENIELREQLAKAESSGG
jgi:hypothetical protein